MDLQKKGWLNDYLKHRKEYYNQSMVDVENPKARIPDQSLYSLIQPTGLMYGQPVHSTVVEDSYFDKLNEEDKMKVLVAESLINSSLLLNHNNIRSINDFTEVIFNTTSKIANFYNKVYPEIGTANRNIFGQKRSNLEIAERVIEKRVHQSRNSKDFWSNFFNNILVFLDIYFFGQWIHTNNDKIFYEFFKQEKDELRFTIIKIMVAAAHANNIVEIEERKLFEYFLKASDFKTQRIKQAWKYLDEGISIDEITIDVNSWILKKFFLELAILVVWADRKLEERELEFLKRFNKILGFYEEDLTNSMLAIEGFVVQYWDKLENLQDRKNLDSVKESYLDKASIVARKNERILSNQVKSSQEISRLIQKYQDGKLNPDESQVLRSHLENILKQIPTFVFISMPSAYLTLPILMEILPKSVYNPQ